MSLPLSGSLCMKWKVAAGFMTQVVVGGGGDGGSGGRGREAGFPQENAARRGR